MARENKRIELKQVDDAVIDTPPTLIRLESDGRESRLTPITILEPKQQSLPTHRLHVPEADDIINRSFEPDLDILIDATTEHAPELEQAWGGNSVEARPIPWGWFALLGLILGGAIAWSLSHVNQAEVKAVEIAQTTQSIISADDKLNQEAEALIQKIETTIKNFVHATTIEDRLKLSRHPERVRKLMENHQRIHGIPGKTESVNQITSLEPITLANQGSFWRATLTLTNKQSRHLLLEVLPDGNIVIDWETYVTYQPMNWDEFVENRPDSSSFDFRVIVEKDHFFSHEFADAKRWNSFRITAPYSEEVLFGYSQANSEISRELLSIISQNGMQRAAVILRLTIPSGLQSPKGAIIEKILCERWIYLKDPT